MVKKEKKFPPEVLIDELDLIKGQADRLAEIISQIHALSSDEIEPEHIAADLNSIAEQSFSLCRHQLETHGIETSLELQSELPSAKVIPNDLRFIFLSLIHNAMSALDKHDENNPTENESELSQKQIQIKTLSDNGKVIARVADSGCGIPPDLAQRLFTTAAPDSNRKGLGLFFCSVLLHQIGGSIRNSSTQNPTVFEVQLPPAD